MNPSRLFHSPSFALALFLAGVVPVSQGASPTYESASASPRAAVQAALGGSIEAGTTAGSNAFVSPVTFSEALAAQKMLAQRVVQAYARTGLRVDPPASAAQLTEAVADFSAGLAVFEALLPGDAPRAGTQDPVRQSLWMLSGQWADARAVIAEPPTIHSALRLAGKMDGALATIDRLGIELAERGAAAPDTSIAALLTRQAELSQRIARAYWLRRLGDDTAAGRQELAAAQRALQANLVMLRAHPERDAHDAAALERIETEVNWLLAAIESDGAGSYPLVVSESAEQVVAQVADFGAARVARP